MYLFDLLMLHKIWYRKNTKVSKLYQKRAFNVRTSIFLFCEVIYVHTFSYSRHLPVTRCAVFHWIIYSCNDTFTVGWFLDLPPLPNLCGTVTVPKLFDFAPDSLWFWAPLNIFPVRRVSSMSFFWYLHRLFLREDIKEKIREKYPVEIRMKLPFIPRCAMHVCTCMLFVVVVRQISFDHTVLSYKVDIPIG